MALFERRIRALTSRAAPRRDTLTLFVCAASLVLVPVTALGQRDPNEVRYEQGVALRAQHRDADAVALYRALYEETHAPRALAQIALAEAALGQWSDAEVHLVDALSAANDPWVQRNRAALEGAQRTIRDHLASLDVNCSTPGAELWIQGRRVAALPMSQPARVIAGTVTFEVRAPGHVTVMRVATVAPNGFGRETVELTASVSRPEASTAPAATLSPATSATTRSPSMSTVRDVARPGATQRTLGWIAVAGAGVFLIGGTVAYVVGLGQTNEYNDTCPPPDAPGLSSDCASRVSSVHTMEALAVTGFVGGGVLAATSAVLLLTAPSSRQERGATGIACGRGPGDLGVACRFAF